MGKPMSVNLNPNKTKSMVLTDKKVTHPSYYFDNNVIEIGHQRRHLGLLFMTLTIGRAGRIM